MVNTYSQGPYTPSDGQLLFLKSGTRAGSASLTWTDSTGTLAVLGNNIVFGGVLPTFDPAVVGQLYVSSGALKVSAGP